ncbi:MAG: DegV family protein [Christensenellaceae bacterium]|nr:DegV family protein [Christensenellaceae bacterium]
MSKNYWIVADVSCDLPLSYIEKQERFRVMPMPYQKDGEEFLYKPGDEKDINAYYDSIKRGALYTTTQINAAEYYSCFKEITDSGEELIALPLSSGISGSVNSALMARERILKENPEAEVIVIDSKCASLGTGILLHHLLLKRESGADIHEAAQYAKETIPKVLHWFTVSDLNHLYRGGRVTRSSAFIGSMLRIKPILHVNDEGRLIPFDKVQGRKKSIRELANKIEENIYPKSNQPIFISHFGCEEDALLLKSYLQKSLPGISEYLIAPQSRIIGAHSGPDCIAVFCLGLKR